MNETFIDLLRDPAHWQFELVVNFVENLATWLVIAILWRKYLEPRIYRHIHRDIEQAGKELPLHKDDTGE